MSRMAKVDTFYENGRVPTVNYLEDIFLDATNTAPDGQTPVHLFSTIMLPIREYDQEHDKLSDTYTYHNVGLLSSEIADLYWTEFSGNYLIGAGCGKSLDEDAEKLKLRCRSIFKKNYGKYLKLIELEGLIWNPLWNVDGTELHQLLESHGDEANIRTMSSRELQGANNQKAHSTAPYDSENYHPEWLETEEGKSDTTSGTVTTTYDGSTYSAQATATDVAYDTGTAQTSLDKKTHDQIAYAVGASDTVFGTALTGADILHTEKTVRQGNIGVTETAKLIEDARKVVMFNIVEEFFSDINKVILIGIYDN